MAYALQRLFMKHPKSLEGENVFGKKIIIKIVPFQGKYTKINKLSLYQELNSILTFPIMSFEVK